MSETTDGSPIGSKVSPQASVTAGSVMASAVAMLEQLTILEVSTWLMVNEEGRLMVKSCVMLVVFPQASAMAYVRVPKILHEESITISE